MRFAVVGVGDFGGKFGGVLATAGLDVTFIARGRRYEEIARNGLHIPPGALGKRTDIDRVKVSNAPADVGPVDVVLFAVKCYQLEEAAVQIEPLLGDDTVVLALQNGITAAERTASIVGRRRVLGYATPQPNAIGELGAPVSPRVRAVCEVLRQAGINVEAVDDIRVPLWNKLVSFAGLSPAIAARLDFGRAAASREIRRRVWEASEEAAAVARAEAVDASPGAGDRVLQFLDFAGRKNPRWRPSLLQDLDAGRRLELEDLVGVIVHRGTAHGIPTPVIQSSYLALKPFELGLPRAGKIEVTRGENE